MCYKWYFKVDFIWMKSESGGDFFCNSSTSDLFSCKGQQTWNAFVVTKKPSVWPVLLEQRPSFCLIFSSTMGLGLWAGLCGTQAANKVEKERIWIGNLASKSPISHFSPRYSVPHILRSIYLKCMQPVLYLPRVLCRDYLANVFSYKYFGTYINI